MSARARRGCSRGTEAPGRKPVSRSPATVRTDEAASARASPSRPTGRPRSWAATTTTTAGAPPGSSTAETAAAPVEPARRGSGAAVDPHVRLRRPERAPGEVLQLDLRGARRDDHEVRVIAVEGVQDLAVLERPGDLRLPEGADHLGHLPAVLE